MKMMIILEGPDNSGKTTLAKYLAWELDMPYVPSEGPEKYPGEIDERILRYNKLQLPAIFDRYPIISHRIYWPIFHQKTGLVNQDLLDEWYKAQKFIIYCRAEPGRGMEGHISSSPVDQLEYIKSLGENYFKLVRAYDDWSLLESDYIYRIGSSMSRVGWIIAGIIYGDQSTNGPGKFIQ